MTVIHLNAQTTSTSDSADANKNDDVDIRDFSQTKTHASLSNKVPIYLRNKVLHRLVYTIIYVLFSVLAN